MLEDNYTRSGHAIKVLAAPAHLEVWAAFSNGSISGPHPVLALGVEVMWAEGPITQRRTRLEGQFFDESKFFESSMGWEVLRGDFDQFPMTWVLLPLKIDGVWSWWRTDEIGISAEDAQELANNLLKKSGEKHSG